MEKEKQSTKEEEELTTDILKEMIEGEGSINQEEDSMVEVATAEWNDGTKPINHPLKINLFLNLFFVHISYFISLS